MGLGIFILTYESKCFLAFKTTSAMKDIKLAFLTVPALYQNTPQLAEVKIPVFRSLNTVVDPSNSLYMWFYVHLFFIIYEICIKT